MTIEEQLDRLNRTTWIVMTAFDVTNQALDINVSRTLNILRDDGYEIIVGDEDCNYTMGELRAIEKVLAWVTQMNYAIEKKEMASLFFEESFDTSMFDVLMEDAVMGLIRYRKLHPDAIPFFIQTAWNQITLKKCPYWIFQELILYKSGLHVHKAKGLFD